MKREKTIPFVVLCVSFLLFSMALPQYGFVKPLYTYYNLSYGARSLSMGNAFTAVVDDLTAVYRNPAGIAEFDSPQFYVNYRKDSLYYYPQTETGSSNGNPQTFSHNLSSRLKNIDFASISVPVNFWNMSWNFALSYYRYIPYNFSAEGNGKLVTTGTGWTNTENSFLLIKGGTGIDTLGFTAAFYLTNTLSFGVTYQRFFNSGDIEYSYAAPNRVYKENFSDKIDGWNVILGLLFKLDKDLALGLSYQTRLKGTFNSDRTFENLLIPQTPVTVSTAANIVMPPQFSAGLMVRPFQFLKLSFDYSVIYWTKANLTHYFDSTTTLPFPVKDNYTFAQKDNVNLRAGLEIRIPIKKFIVFLRSGLFNDKQLFVSSSDGAVKVKGYSLGLGLDISSKVKLDAGYMRQTSHWNEMSYFNTQNIVKTYFKNKTLCLALTFNFGKLK